MTILKIDALTQAFYDCVCFKEEHYPKYDLLQELFYGDGKLINGNYDQPLEFTVQGYVQAIMQQIENGNASFYSQQEISDRTEVFGNTAQRLSVYEYSNSPNAIQPWKKGVNFMQFILINNSWKIVSTIWTDEKEALIVPDQYLV